MFEQEKEVKKVIVTYADGSEKVIDRGVCFSVHDDGEFFKVQCHGVAGSQMDCTAVLAIVTKIATECGIYAELVDKAETVEPEREKGGIL